MDAVIPRNSSLVTCQVEFVPARHDALGKNLAPAEALKIRMTFAISVSYDPRKHQALCSMAGLRDFFI